MSGPWEKYQTPAVPTGFRIVSPLSPSKPRFPGIPIEAAQAVTAQPKPRFSGVPVDTSDPWAAFPDSEMQPPAASALPPGFKVISQPDNAKGARVGNGAFSSANGGGTADSVGPWRKYQAAASDPWAAFPDAPAAPELPPGFKVVGKPGPWEKYAGQAQNPGSPIEVKAPELSVAKDIGLSVASGVPRGIVETAMTPITLNRVGEGVGSWLYDKAEGPVRSVLGMDPATPGLEHDHFKDALLNPLTGAVNYALRTISGNDNADVRTGVYDTQDRTREVMDAVLHKPETRLGKYAGTIAEFAAPGGLPSKAARFADTGVNALRKYGSELLGNVVIPAAASETAGWASEGTPYEGLMRFLGAAFGNAGAAATRAYNAPEAAVRRATEGTADAEWTAAKALQDNTTGVALSGPEAHAQARGGASKLLDLQRVVEGSTTGGNKTGPFYAQRPGQVDRAVGNELDRIAPQSIEPHSLGPRASEAASNVLDQTRRSINDETRPLYQAAELQTIPDAQFATLKANPSFQVALDRLRNNPEFARYGNMPENSVAVVDAVSKDMLARGEMMAERANPLYGPELGAQNTAGATDARNVASTTSPEYAQALAEQEALRRTVLNPLEQGPVGQVAKATDTTGAGNALLPPNPLSGSAPSAADATRRLAAEDPATTAALVRQNLADRYSAAQTETQSGSRESTGAKFHRSVAGNDERSALLDAVLRALPGNQSAGTMQELLDVLQATMRRQGPGSATEPNRMITSELGAASPAAAVFDIVKSVGGSIINKAGDATKRASLRDGLGTLADMFIAPNSVDLIRNAKNNSGGRIAAEAAARTAAEAGGTLYDPAGRRVGQ